MVSHEALDALAPERTHREPQLEDAEPAAQWQSEVHQIHVLVVRAKVVRYKRKGVS